MIFQIDVTKITPYVLIDKGEIIIHGRSIPEDSFEFYEPVVEACMEYIRRPAKHTEVRIHLDYVNSGSKKYLTNILTILDLAGIPFRSCERDTDSPLVLGGGPCAFHPEPVADFFDAILLGDGEEAVLEIAGCVKNAKQEGLSRADLLDRLSAIQGVYVPALFEAGYGPENEFKGMTALKGGYEKVAKY